MTSNLYVIGPADGPFKIGHAGDVLVRLSGIQSGHHQQLVLHASRPTQTPRECEAKAHNRLAAYRLRGEWFDCPLEEACRAIEAEHDPAPQEPPTPPTTAENFNQWLRDMKMIWDIGETECRYLLGMSENEFNLCRVNGGPPMLSYAMRGIYHNMRPYGDERQDRGAVQTPFARNRYLKSA